MLSQAPLGKATGAPSRAQPQGNPAPPPRCREAEQAPTKVQHLSQNGLSLSSFPGHEGLSKPLGLVGPPDVCGGFGWGVKAAYLSDSSPLCGFITWGFGSGYEVVLAKQSVIWMHTFRLPPDLYADNRSSGLHSLLKQ